MTAHKAVPKGDLYRKISSLIPPEAWKSTVPIIIVRGETLQVFGTGTLFRIADQSFIVTAAHVIKNAERDDAGLCVARTNDTFVQVHGKWICTAEGKSGTKEDPFDVAIHHLDSTVVDKLSDKSFLRLNNVGFTEDLSTGVFCLFGYPTPLSKPSTNSETRLSLKGFEYTTYAFHGPTGALAEYQERFHLLLNANESEMTDIDGKPMDFRNREGFRIDFPGGLGGMSGCSVWKIIGDRNRPIEEWNKEQPRIVAVQTGVYHQRQIIVATRWVAVLTLLHEVFPELRPAMSLWHVG